MLKLSDSYKHFLREVQADYLPLDIKIMQENDTIL